MTVESESVFIGDMEEGTEFQLDPSGDSDVYVKASVDEGAFAGGVTPVDGSAVFNVNQNRFTALSNSAAGYIRKFVVVPQE